MILEGRSGQSAFLESPEQSPFSGRERQAFHVAVRRAGVPSGSVPTLAGRDKGPTDRAPGAQRRCDAPSAERFRVARPLLLFGRKIGPVVLGPHAGVIRGGPRGFACDVAGASGCGGVERRPGVCGTSRDR